MNVNVQDITDRTEEAFKGAAIINNNQPAETDFEENFLNKKASKIMGCDVIGCIHKDESSEVTHGIQQICFTTIIGNFTRSPEINMEDVKGATERPRENKFTVTGHSSIGGNAVGALKDPAGDIFAAVRPEKPKANAV
jgi:hypothetical protein